MTQSSLKFVPYGANSHVSAAMILRKYFGNYGDNKPVRGESTFAIHPVGSYEPGMNKRSMLTLEGCPGRQRRHDSPAGCTEAW